MNYYSTNLYLKILNCAIAEGVSDETFSKIPYPPDSIEELQGIPAEDYFSTFELLEENLPPGFAIRVGQQMKIEDYGVLGLSWKTCSWVGEIFERSERYFKLLSNTFVWKIEEEGDISHIYLLRNPHRRGLELSCDASLSATVVVLQALSEKLIKPVEVCFKHSPDKELSSHREAFNCPILFNQPYYRISYTKSDLDIRTAKADESINKFLLERVAEKTEGLEIVGNKVVRDVEHLIKDALPSGIPSINQIGMHIGMSKRTLARRLSEAGVSFRDLIKKTQEDVAKHLLRHSTRNIAEIAFEIGFSEQSAFNRAFKRWQQ